MIGPLACAIFPEPIRASHGKQKLAWAFAGLTQIPPCRFCSFLVLSAFIIKYLGLKSKKIRREHSVPFFWNLGNANERCRSSGGHWGNYTAIEAVPRNVIAWWWCANPALQVLQFFRIDLSHNCKVTVKKKCWLNVKQIAYVRIPNLKGAAKIQHIKTGRIATVLQIG